MIYLLSVYLGVYFSYQLFFKNQVLSLLSSNLPFREFYVPTFPGLLFTYLNPITMGFFAGYFFYQPRRTYIYYLNLALFFGLLNILAFIINSPDLSSHWFNYHLQTYYLMIFPLLFFVGCAPYWLKLRRPFFQAPNFIVTPRHHLMASILGLTLFTLNCLPLFNSPFLVGADIYYHAAMTQQVSGLSSIFQSPFFLESRNYYYSIVYFLVSNFSRIFSVPILQSWILLPSICSLIFIYFYFLSSLKLTRSALTALLSSVFVFPFNQILWYDPSLRIFSYTFFILFLYSFVTYLSSRRPIYVVQSLVFFVLTAASHPEIALHAFLILLIYSFYHILLKHQHRLKLILNPLIRPFIGIRYPQGSLALSALKSYRSLLILLSLYFLVFVSRIFELITNFSVSSTMIFNEIPFSLFQPYGITSFLVFLFLPLGLLKIIRQPHSSSLLLLSISSLFPVIIFYFTYFWSLYHRYFPETAYLAFAIISAIAVGDLVKRFSLLHRLAFTSLLISLLILSIFPKYRFINNYSKSVAASLSNMMPYLTFLKSNTPPKSVILVPPDDMLNRYIPFYSNRFVFAGSNAKSKERQWQVLSFCNGPFQLDCDTRLSLADNLFKDPNPNTLNQILSSYHMDYIFFDPKKYPKLYSFLQDNLNLTPVSSVSSYALFSLKSTNL